MVTPKTQVARPVCLSDMDARDTAVGAHTWVRTHADAGCAHTQKPGVGRRAQFTLMQKDSHSCRNFGFSLKALKDNKKKKFCTTVRSSREDVRAFKLQQESNCSKSNVFCHLHAALFYLRYRCMLCSVHR